MLVACVGNVLRGDDGFGPAVTERLADLPDGVEVIETGIGGVALLQELLAGCDGLILIDAVDRRRSPARSSSSIPRSGTASTLPTSTSPTPSAC